MLLEPFVDLLMLDGVFLHICNEAGVAPHFAHKVLALLMPSFFFTSQPLQFSPIRLVILTGPLRQWSQDTFRRMHQRLLCLLLLKLLAPLREDLVDFVEGRALSAVICEAALQQGAQIRRKVLGQIIVSDICSEKQVKQTQ